MTQEEKNETMAMALYMGLAATYGHMAFCKECREKFDSIVRHATTEAELSSTK